MHLAAESHVDRSIDGPADFIQTNVVGTYVMLEAALEYWRTLPADAPRLSASCTFRPTKCSGRSARKGFFAKIRPMRRTRPIRPPRPARTISRAPGGTPTACRPSSTNCSNNYGPYHFPEKLIPLMILNAIEGKPLPVYGRGENMRDWLYVEDHAEALILGGAPGGRGRDLIMSAGAMNGVISMWFTPSASW